MFKPFIVNGQLVNGALLEAVNKNKLTRACISARVFRLHWTLERACTTPKKTDEEIKASKYRYSIEIKSKNPVKRYFLTPEQLAEVHKKYGPPGKIMYPERQENPMIHW